MKTLLKWHHHLGVQRPQGSKQESEVQNVYGDMHILYETRMNGVPEPAYIRVGTSLEVSMPARSCKE